MKVPSRDIGGFAREVIARCTASQTQRLLRGAAYRSLFLTGDPEGEPQVYNKTNLYIEKLSSWLYSPVDMKFGMETDGPVSVTEAAMGKTAIAELHKYIRRGNVDRKTSEAVKWSLIKGKAFVKLLWGGGNFQPMLVQPEVMGVEREDLTNLDEQQAFVHSSWYTIDSFVNLVWNNPDKDALLRKAANMASADAGGDRALLKKVVVGGGWNDLYRASSDKTKNTSRGFIDWIGAPSPHLAPELASRMLQVDELWLWDDEREDWTTIQLLAGAGDDAVVFGKYQHRNIFADAFDPNNKDRKGTPDPHNPLKGMHPFVEFCPNELDGYFWGRSEIENTALLQSSINKRVEGINSLLRRQENPPRAFMGMAGATQNTIARLSKPGGYITEPNPGGKIENLAPEMPSTLWQSLHELNQMFDDMGGVTSTLGGEGDAGVRSQNHAETLLRASTPHIKDRAIDIERSVSELGNLGLYILRAQLPTKLTAWVRESKATIEAMAARTTNVEEAPVKDLVPVEFLMADLPDSMHAIIDGHSSSPAFEHEHQQLMLMLAMRGAISPQKLVEALHPPHEADIIDDLEQKQVDQAEMIKAHPELLTKGKKK